jgi:hypothetical protein
MSVKGLPGGARLSGGPPLKMSQDLHADTPYVFESV